MIYKRMLQRSGMDGFMSRRDARELALHMIYAGEYSEKLPVDLVKETLTPEYFETMAGEYDLYRAVPPKEQMEYLHRAVEGVLSHGPELDSYLEKYAVGWSVSRISRISKCIMRLSMYEMMYLQIPVAASVNEAVEMAKKYESDEAASFINGLLATFVKKELSI